LRGSGTFLLFLTREPTTAEIRLKGNYRKSFVFQGAFNVCGYEVVIPSSGSRARDKLFQFHLIPVKTADFPDKPEKGDLDLVSLRQRVVSQIGIQKKPPSLSIATYRQRSREIRKYALLRSSGKCEACGTPAPFVNDDGEGFLEVHHIKRLADEGIDEPENVTAICPNCHRRAHYSCDREEFRKHLLFVAQAAELRLSAVWKPESKKLKDEILSSASLL
jgi:5-methylcytosine-specific restriction protein A